MKYLILSLMLAGCAASFQPFPAQVSRQEITEAFAQRDQALKGLAEILKKLQGQTNATAPKLEKK